MRKISTIFSSLLPFLFFYSTTTHATPLSADAYIDSYLNNPPPSDMPLGGAYDAYSLQRFEPCVSVAPLLAGAVQSSHVSGFRVGVEDPNANIDLFGGKNFKPDGNPFKEYSSLIAKNAPYLISWLETSLNEFPRQVTTSFELNDRGKNALKLGKVEFVNACGNRFVMQRSVVMRLYNSVQFQFANDEERARATKVLQGYQLIALSTDLKKIALENGIDLAVVVRPMQFGGDPRKLLSLKDATGETLPTRSVCTVENLEPCRALTRAMSDYMQDVNTFKQVDATDPSYDGPSIEDYYLMDYGLVGVSGLPIFDFYSAEIDLERFANEIATANTAIDRAEILLNYFAHRMDATQKAALSTFIEETHAKVNQLKSAGLTCMADHSRCRDLLFAAPRLPIDESLLQLPVKPMPTASEKAVSNPSSGSKSGAMDVFSLALIAMMLWMARKRLKYRR